MTEYWVVVDGKPSGPYTAGQLMNMNLTPDTPVWRKGLIDWVKLSELPDGEFVVTEAEAERVERPVVIPAIPQPQFSRPEPVKQPDEPAELAPSYLIWSVLSTLFCCLPLGIVAIMMSIRVNSLNARGFYDEARRCSRNTELWIIASFTFGLVSAPFVTLFQMAMAL